MAATKDLRLVILEIYAGSVIRCRTLESLNNLRELAEVKLHKLKAVLDSLVGERILKREDGKKYCYLPRIAAAPAKSIRRLKDDVLCLFFFSSKGWHALKNLQELVNLKPRRLKNILDGLASDGLLEHKGDLYRLLPTHIRIPSHKIRYGIGQSVWGATEALTTEELAHKLGLNSGQVYQVCRRLENKGYFTSEIKDSEKRVFFAPLTGEVVHAGNFQRLDVLYKNLDAIVAEFSPGDTKTERSLQSFFADLLKKKEYEKYRKPISSSKEDLLRTVSSAKKKSDVNELLRLRPFHPKVRTWGSSIKSSTRGLR